MPLTTRNKGVIAEDIACSFLTERGLKLLIRNYHSPQGEVDLIMKDGEVTVFVEVRSRKNNSTLNVLETIDTRKRNHIIRTCEHYLQSNKLTNKNICRFDIVLISGNLETAEISWLKNAFEA